MSNELVRAVARDGNLRFVVVRNTELVQVIANQHQLKGALLSPFGNIITTAQLLATQLKGPGTASVRLESDGIMSFAAADSTPFGLTRALVPQKVLEAAALDPSRPVVGKGTLSVTKILNHGAQPYKGIVQLVPGSVALSVAYYLDKSEQIRSCVGLATSFDHAGVVSSGGFMVQVFPKTPESSIERMEETVGSLGDMSELFAKSVDCEGVLERLADGFDVEVVRRDQPSFHCPCTRERSTTAVIALGAEEIEALSRSNEPLNITCDYCRERYAFSPDELAAICQKLRSTDG
jgi:molecular chaperone Hsp33